MNNREWFQHKIAGHDIRIDSLNARYGIPTGYGHWYLLLEEMYASGGFIDASNVNTVKALVRAHDMTDVEFMGLIDAMADMGLVLPDPWSSEKHIVNDGVIKQNDYLEQCSVYGKDGGRGNKKG